MTYDRGTCSKSSPVFCWCLIWFWGKFRKISQNFAKNRFKSYNSTANFSISKIQIFRINRYQPWVCWNISILHYRGTNLESSKIEGTGPLLMSHSIQFHCFCFHFSTVSKRETLYAKWHMTGVYVLSHRQSFAGVQFDFWGNFAKFRKKSI